jgi:hypothetical protein
VFVDGSMIEAYVDSAVSITARAYPVGADATGLALRLPDDSRVIRLGIHRLDPASTPITPPSKDLHAAAR